MNSFTFQTPAAFVFLLLLIPIGWLLQRARAKRRSVTDALGSTYSTHRKLRDTLRLSALALAITALAKPGYNPQTHNISNTGRDIVFALDVSRSMLAEDVLPSRLEVAKQAIRDTLDTLNSERVGLVVYAGSSSILCPLTDDHNFVSHMLDQAHPRSVDFGGTTMQSAIEKTVDQVFLDGRQDTQDMIILTDGGDHGSKLEKAAKLLDEHKANALILGIGNPNLGSTIPISPTENLTIDGKTILTRLEDASLTHFSQLSSRSQYIPVATSPFNLGQIYADYAKDKATVSSDHRNGYTTYQDASMFLLTPALILLILAECWGLKGLQIGHTVALCFVFYQSPIAAAVNNYQSQFHTASSLMQDAQYTKAAEEFQDLYQQLNDHQVDSKILAACTFNQGLCYYQLSQLQVGESATTAHQYASRAQQLFLAAKRYDKGFIRASKRIISTTQWLTELDLILRNKQQVEDQIAKEIQALTDELKSILDAQTKLTTSVLDSERKQRKLSATEIADLIQLYPLTQQALITRTTASKAVMLKLHSQLAIHSPDKKTDQRPESIMTLPIQHIDQVISIQQSASKALTSKAQWSAARSQQNNAISLIKKIIEILSGSSGSNSENEEEDTDDEEAEYEEAEEENESSMSSESTQGDLSASSQMQDLPEPNYSADDILKEEQSNLQFRQEKRAKKNASKVKKDY